MEYLQTTLKLAFAAYNAGRTEEAEALCRTLVQAGLEDGQMYFLLGMALHKAGEETEALQWLQRAAQVQPEMGRVFSGLGCVQQKLGDAAGAASSFARAAELEPQQADHFFSLGNALYQLARLEAAEAAFQRAVALNPRDAESWNNLGKCLKELNRVQEAIAAYDQALALDARYGLALQGRALSLLTAGRLAEGFRDQEERRQLSPPRHFDGARWTGQPIPGKTLLLHAEQGFGDGIFSARHVQLVRPHCGRVVLECRPELKTLFVHSGVAEVVVGFGEELPPFDFYASAVSLTGLLNLAPGNIPAVGPYLQAPMAEVPAAGGTLKVGLVWAGNPAYADDASRSLSLEQLAPVLAVSGVTFYSLQQPLPSGNEGRLKEYPNLRVLGGFKDYLATAAAVAGMDLIIAVDTSVAHLAGALGKPVWTLVPFAPDWRWFQEFGDTTPWYPTMRLFRQSERGVWPPVIARVAGDLERWAGRMTNAE